jgi:hypothetical protein
MLQVARLCRRQLHEASDRVLEFILGQLSPDGGFRGRDGRSDLYYTVFGIESLVALLADPPAGKIVPYLTSFRDGDGLDFVHLACLARAWAGLGREHASGAPAAALLDRIEAHRTADGGYAASAGAAHGTVYACFLGLGAYQDLGGAPPDVDRLLSCVEGLRAADGGYSNEPGAASGLTPPTAAAVGLRRQLGAQPAPGSAEWLLARAHREGGFHAGPRVPVPDLLSTATALHALAGLRADIDAIREPCLDFVDTLWSSRGGFYGSWADDVLDCEYTYYGLLALGHLSV